MNRETYATETTTTTLNGKQITVTHLTPILSPEEHEKRRREIEHKLYDIFAKYAAQKAATGRDSGTG